MLGRFLAVILGIAGILAGSQAPNFTYNFLQNLEGRIDELGRFKADIESDRARAGMTRAMAQKGCEAAPTAQLKDDCDRAEDILVRYDDLTALQKELKDTGSWMQPITLVKSIINTPSVREVAENTRKEYKVAVPATPEGLGYGGGTGVGFWLIGRLLFGIIGAPFKRY